MKPLIWKEVRENLALAVLGLVLAILSLGGLAGLDLAWARALATGRIRADFDLAQPLTSEGLLIGSIWFCAIFGAVLGWLQIQNERHRDLWAFLVHRPLTRTQIFAGKLAAGVGIYFTALGGPLLLFVLWVAFLAPRLAPFEWGMVLPVITSLLTGVVFYFAGMLTSLRETRWYGSRALPLVVAVVVAAFVADNANFWVITAGIVLSVAVMALACWGAFGTHGHYHEQPLIAKVASTGIFATAGFWIGTLIVGISFNLAFAWAAFRASSSYTITRDGTIYKAVYPGGGPTQIVDLEGNPVKDATTGRKMDVVEFNRKTALNVSVSPEFNPEPHFWYRLRQRSYFFYTWRVTEGTAWYFWRRYARLVAFDLKNQQLLGSLGPEGFVPGSPAGKPGFSQSQYYYSSGTDGFMHTDTTAYRVDVEDRTSTPIFTTTADDPIGGVQQYTHEGLDQEYVVVVTRHAVRLLARNGKELWKAPFEPGYPEYGHVQVYFLEPPKRFALWIFPGDRFNARAGWKLPIQVTWLSADEGPIKTANLPVLGIPKELEWPQRMFNVFSPAVMPLEAPLAKRTGTIDWQGSLVAGITALVLFAPLTWWLCVRYAFPLGARVGWTVFILLAGFPGLLAFLSLQEWPAREPCANCRKPRVVKRRLCEHCGAEFPSPEKTGTEIFAAI